MAIWSYEESQAFEHDDEARQRPTEDLVRDFYADMAARSQSSVFHLSNTTSCPYCSSSLNVLAGAPLPDLLSKGMNAAKLRVLLGCPGCGWWSALYLDAQCPYLEYDAGYCDLRRSDGVLKDLDLADLSIPAQELRTYLLAKYGDRFHVHPRKYEEIVGGVFSDFGFRVRVTSFSGDEGIDVFVLDGDDNATAGIQVKRYRGKISAEQIRSFVGALVLQGLTTGIYITPAPMKRAL